MDWLHSSYSPRSSFLSLTNTNSSIKSGPALSSNAIYPISNAGQLPIIPEKSLERVEKGSVPNYLADTATTDFNKRVMKYPDHPNKGFF